MITNVDPSVTAGSPAATSRTYAIAAQQISASEIYGYNPTDDPTIQAMPTGSYNAELVKQLSPAMQAILGE